MGNEKVRPRPKTRQVYRQAATNRRAVAPPRKRAQDITDGLDQEEVSDDLVEPGTSTDIDSEITEDINAIVDARISAYMQKLQRQAKRRRAMKKAQEEEEEAPAEEPAAEESESEEEVEAPWAGDEESGETKEERRARAMAQAKRNAAKRKALKKAEEADDIENAEVPEEVKPESTIDEVTARKLRAMKSRKRAQEITDGLDQEEVSDDMTEEINPDANDDNVQQTPEELPDSIDEAEEKVLAAYELLEARIANGIENSKIRKQSRVAEYCKQYSTREMRLLATDLRKIGRAGKSTGNVRIAARTAALSNPSIATSRLSDECLFA